MRNPEPVVVKGHEIIKALQKIYYGDRVAFKVALQQLEPQRNDEFELVLNFDINSNGAIAFQNLNNVSCVYVVYSSIELGYVDDFSVLSLLRLVASQRTTKLDIALASDPSDVFRLFGHRKVFERGFNYSAKI